MSKTINIDNLVQATSLDISLDEKTKESVYSVLNWVVNIQDVNTDGIQPMFNTLEDLGLNNARADAREGTPSFDELSSNAKNKRDAFFLTPKVIG